MSLFSPQWPLTRGDNTYKTFDNVEQQINFFIKNLLLTSPGENISDRFYGVGLRSFLFEQQSDASYSAARAAIDSQIARYIPFIENVLVDIDSDSRNIDAGLMSIKIHYQITGDTERRMFDLSVNQSNTIGIY